MSTCRWCTPSGTDTTEFLKNYASKRLSQEELEGSNDDLSYCLECVVEYHRAREKLPGLHEVLWEMETSRLIARIEKSTKEEVGEDDELFIVDENGDTQLSGYVDPDFENNLRVPLLEILKYPYLLLHEKVSELCVEVLCRMEQGQNSFQVFEKCPGIYVFLVHPNEVIRRWAILTARNLGKVDRDDYYDLQEVLTCLFKVIELGLFDNPDIYSSSLIEKGKLILLPSHLYDTTNYKNYWLGICMLLTVLEEQAMDSLLLGPDKQNDFMQSILNTMEKEADDDSTDPFWPALHCFMVILDQLGSKVWGQLIDPIQAFQTIINSVSYNNELKNIRDSFKRTKCEPQSDCDDEMITCSQIVYNYNTEKPQKDTGWKTAICPDYCPNMYEEMQTLANMLQSDIGRDMRVHHSTFLWFIPFVQSLMDLKNLGVEYIVEVIHYLCSEIGAILNEKIQQCDKVSEFFVLILVSIIELHRNKKCLHLLWVSSQEWVEAVVRCAKLPAIAFTRCTEKASGNYPRVSSSSQTSHSVQHACVQLIRSLLREGYQIGQNALCKKYLDKLNLLLRGNLSRDQQPSIQETQELQLCLKKVIRSIRDRAMNTSVPAENNANSTTLPTLCIKQEKRTHDDECKMSVSSRDELYSPFSFISKGVGDGCQENPFPRRNDAWEEESRDAPKSSRYITERHLVDMYIKKEPVEMAAQGYDCLQNSWTTKMCGEVQKNMDDHPVSGNSNKSNWSFSSFKRRRELENKYEIDPMTSKYLVAQTSSDSPERARSSDEKESNLSPDSSSKFKIDADKLMNVKQKMLRTDWTSKLSHLVKQPNLQNSCMSVSASKAEADQLQQCSDSTCTSRDHYGRQGVSTVCENEVSVSSQASRSFENKQEENMNQDQEQPDLSNFIKEDCKGQNFRTLHIDKTSSRGHVPFSFEDKSGVSNTALQVIPLSMKCEPSDGSVVSKYFKKENCLVGESGEDFARMASGDSILTDSEIDRDLSKLSLAAYAKSVNFSMDSNQESSVDHNRCDIKRKVKGAVRLSSSVQSSKSPCGVDCLDNQIIIISDSSDGEENVPLDKQTKKANEVEGPEEKTLTPSCISKSEMEKELKMPSSPLFNEECGSQYFEFETEEEVFSVWQDTQLYAMEDTQEYKTDRVATSIGSSDSDNIPRDYTNEWGYDTDYISDDTIEKEASKVEKQVENLAHQKEAANTEAASSSTLQDSISKGNEKEKLENSTDKSAVAKDLILNTELTEPRASTSNLSLASKLAIKKNSVSPRINLAKSKVLRTVQISPKRTLLKTAKSKKLAQNTSKTSQPGRLTPAVVPPRKIRQCPAPTSTAEKLGLKKAPRKAFELSQRSLESVAQLRSYGKAAGKVGTAQRQRTKLITPQTLSVKNNKKMLACQDLQFLRQTRPKQSVRGKNLSGSSDSRSKKASKVTAKSAEQKPKGFGLTSVEGGVENQGRRKMEQAFGPSTSRRNPSGDVCLEKEGIQTAQVSKTPVFSDSDRKMMENSAMISPVPMDVSLYSAAAAEEDKDNSSERGVVQSSFESSNSKENLCKSNDKSGGGDDDDDDDLFLTQLDPVDMELCSQEENDGEITIPSKPMEIDAAENLEQNKPLNIVKCKHEGCVEEVERIGEYCSKHSAAESEKDNLFVKPLLPPSKTRKPSTTKIFSSVSSSRNAAFSKDLEDVKKPPPSSKSKVNAEKPVVFRPPPVKAVSSGNQVFKIPSFSNIPKSCVSSNVLQPQNIQNASNIPRQPVREEYSSFLGAQQRDHSILVKEVLKWTYEMFANFRKYGPPDSLLQSVVVSVPINFQGYDDYFHTFFPLMMLNAFETLVQDWLESQRMKERSYYFHLQSFSADLNRADFTAHIRESDLARQLHPKEDDLIFLEIQERKNSFGEENEVVNHLEQPVGLVTRFSRAAGSSARQNEQHLVCHLSVQTQSNLSRFINKKVKCVVVGSLITTQRMFKGLLLLSRSPLARAIINPNYNDFYPKDLPLSSESNVYMKDYNKDQKRAIDTAYAIVKRYPTVPKICLIHGPPGTGKSKTIVGLLSRVLRENTRNEKTTQKPNSKIKQNRFLVCAPSNAAVDELMKKIIVEFKEKCQNRREPLGNCGDIHLVRLGAEKSISSEVRGFSLDKQVEHRMKRKLPNRDQDIQKRKEALDQKLDMLSRQRARHRCEKREINQMLDDEIGKLSKERQQLASQLKEVRGCSQKIQADILLESDIICCTLSTSGGILLKSAFSRQGLDPFSCVIVDEAGQSCEVETLIPLIHRCNKLVLVGDPKQLPPTVKSQKAQDYGYDQSLMARLHRHLEIQVQQNICKSLPVVQLTVQYRMHPDICLFPSSYIYGRSLKTDKATEENRCSSEWPFQPYLIFDVRDGREERDNDSFSNPQEVKLVIELIKAIKEKKKDFGLRQIGIITPYSAQKKKIQEELERVFQNNSSGEVDTVDAFQGREKDCVIVTCVRANSSKGSIGFLASLQRLNVTITRARFSLFILGRLETLMENEDWNRLIQNAEKRGAIIKTLEKSYKKDAAKILKLKPSGPKP
ncbi:SETX helicase, partial [Eudromia elegans]|nr:SETX helicase [Eudromia elegans]